MLTTTTGVQGPPHDGAQLKEQVEKLGVAGDSWEATLLAILLQLCKLLVVHTEGATGLWRQLRRRSWKGRQARGGGKLKGAEQCNNGGGC